LRKSWEKQKLNFMENKLDLNKMELAPMTEDEMKGTEGGSFWGALAVLAGAAVAILAAPVVGAVLIVGGAIEMAVNS
jgi:hypothetical protein